MPKRLLAAAYSVVDTLAEAHPCRGSARTDHIWVPQITGWLGAGKVAAQLDANP